MEARERVKEYRKSLGMTQREFAKLLHSELGLNYNVALVSYAEKGIVDFPESVVSYCDSKIGFKPFINEFDEGLGGKWITIPHDEKKCVKSAISEMASNVLDELKYYTIDHPFIAKDFGESIGCKEVNVRSAIRELRLNGIRICSDPTHRGYWLEENGGGYEVTRKQMLSRAFRLLEVVKAMDNNQDGQMEWVDGLG